MDNLTETCVYTIVTRDVLDRVALENAPLVRTERKRWTTAAHLFDLARRDGRRLPLLIADAKDCSRLLYWGILESIAIRANGTSYTVDRLRPFHGEHSPQELVLVSPGRTIASGFIRPYAICRTPDFIFTSDTPENHVFISPEEGLSSDALLEGTAVRVTVNAYERNAEARKRCIDHYGFACGVCELNFAEKYGEIGADFIHVHHLTPVSEIGEQYVVDPVRDLRPVCPNCHAMLHRRRPPFSVEELRERLKR